SACQKQKRQALVTETLQLARGTNTGRISIEQHLGQQTRIELGLSVPVVLQRRVYALLDDTIDKASQVILGQILNRIVSEETRHRCPMGTIRHDNTPTK